MGSIVAEPLAIHRLGTRAERRQRVRERCTRRARPPPRERFPHAFSGGQRQRIGIARAIASARGASCPTSPCRPSTSPCRRRSATFCSTSSSDGPRVPLHLPRSGAWCDLSDRVCVMYLGRIVEEARRAGAPRAAAPLHARPARGHAVARSRAAARARGAGGAASRRASPSGCRFHPRCPVAFDRCPTDDPKLPEGERAAACWLVPGN